MVAAPPPSECFPYRAVDAASKAARKLAEDVAAGHCIDLLKEFSRTAATASGGASRACIEGMLGSAYNPHEHRESTSNLRALEWLACMQRYADAVAVVDGTQGRALREYARFILDLACLVPFGAVEAHERLWREACANTGAPINSWGGVYRHFHALTGIHVLHNQQREVRSAATGDAATKRQRKRDRDGASAAAPTKLGGAPAQRVLTCNKFNRGVACDPTSCNYAHVCKKCRGSHSVKNCSSGGGAGAAPLALTASGGSGAASSSAAAAGAGQRQQ